MYFKVFLIWLLSCVLFIYTTIYHDKLYLIAPTFGVCLISSCYIMQILTPWRTDKNVPYIYYPIDHYFKK